MTSSLARSEIRVLIVDDEPLARRGLRQVLKAHSDCRVIAESRTGKEALLALRTMTADVVFLDVKMPGLNGFQVMDAIADERPPLVVLVTAFDQFAVRAYEAEALDYLLKPVTQERFDMAMDRIRERLRSNQAIELSQRLGALFDPGAVRTGAGAGAPLRTLVVPTETGDLVLNADEVDWIQSEDYYSAIHALGRRHLIRESLASLEKRLDPVAFMRVHRSAIVSLDRVREVRIGDDGSARLLLRNGTEIPVSRRRREQLAGRIRRP